MFPCDWARSGHNLVYVGAKPAGFEDTWWLKKCPTELVWVGFDLWTLFLAAVGSFLATTWSMLGKVGAKPAGFEDMWSVKNKSNRICVGLTCFMGLL